MTYLKTSHSIIIYVLSIIFLIYKQVDAFPNVYPKLKNFPLNESENAGNPLFLTPLIESGDYDNARRQASVQYTDMLDIDSYSGYLTVDKKYNSNMFFWFFPARHDPKNAPVVLWLQGGPGASSLYGLFTENGPFRVTKNKTLAMRKYSWSLSHNLIYIDNPVGTGYSFTDHDEGYARNETQVGLNLYAAMIQFFELFSELQSNDFFVTGESYAGKYVPSLAYAIHQKNPSAKTKINLKGLAIGNGFSDPINQLNYADYLYQLGLIDYAGQQQFKKLQNEGVALINQSKYDEAFEIFDKLIDGDLNSPSSLFQNLTGFQFYFNYLRTHDNNESDWMAEWIQSADARRAIHVGNCTFNVENKHVEEYLKNDIARSVADKIALLLQYYKVLIYNGQLDIIVAYPLTENYLSKLMWSGANEYKKAQRKIWKVNGEIAGYAKVVLNLSEVIVRNAGHMVPADQPQWAFDLIKRFTHGKKF